MKSRLALAALISICVLVSVSCATQRVGKAKLRFAYDEFYMLSVGEKHMELTPSIVRTYENFNGLYELNMPLNKYVQSAKYDTYIAVGIDKPMDVLLHAVEADSTILIVDRKQVDKYLSIFYKKEGMFAIKTIFSERKVGMPIFINTVGVDSTIIRTMYNENQIISKLK